jgi:hypothetical protein
MFSIKSRYIVLIGLNLIPTRKHDVNVFDVSSTLHHLDGTSYSETVDCVLKN